MRKNFLLYNIVLILILSAAILFTLLMWMFLFTPEVPNYSVTDDYTYTPAVEQPLVQAPEGSEIEQIESLSLPVKTGEQMGQWAATVVMNSLTLNFYDLVGQYDKLKPFFTENGYNSFVEATRPLQQSIINKKLSTTAVLTGVPVPVVIGTYQGTEAWQFNMPVLVSYESLSQTVTQRQNVTVLIKRVPVSQDNGLSGIAVDSFVSTG